MTYSATSSKEAPSSCFKEAKIARIPSPNEQLIASIPINFPYPGYVDRDGAEEDAGDQDDRFYHKNDLGRQTDSCPHARAPPVRII